MSVNRYMFERAPVAHEIARMETIIPYAFTYCFLSLRSTPFLVASLIHQLVPFYTKVNFTIVKIKYTMINDNVLR